MSDVLDPDLVLLIYHHLHKKLSEMEELSDNDIKMILIQTLKEAIPELEIQIKNKNRLLIKKNDKSIEISIQKWIDNIKTLYNNYSQYLSNS